MQIKPHNSCHKASDFLGSLNQSIVIFKPFLNPSKPPYCGRHLVKEIIFSLLPKSLCTSDLLGLILSYSGSNSILQFINSAIRETVSPIDISNLLAELITSPMVFEDFATDINASDVSFTKLKSLVGVKFPSLNLVFLFAN